MLFYKSYKQNNAFNSVSKIQPVMNYAIRTTLAVVLPIPLAVVVKRKT